MFSPLICIYKKHCSVLLIPVLPYCFEKPTLLRKKKRNSFDVHGYRYKIGRLLMGEVGDFLTENKQSWLE